MVKYDKDYWPGSGKEADDYKALQERLYPESIGHSAEPDEKPEEFEEFKLRDDKTYKAPTEVTLVAKDGTLYFPDEVLGALGNPGPIVMVVYDEGDADSFSWPSLSPGIKKLRSALYDAAMTGDISEKTIVKLPNGKVVEFV